MGKAIYTADYDLIFLPAIVVLSGNGCVTPLYFLINIQQKHYWLMNIIVVFCCIKWINLKPGCSFLQY